MNIQQLEYIVALDKHRHFQRAAEACGVSQPTLSALVQKLEEELDLTLFDRKSHPICPTESGRAVAEMVFERHEILTKVLTSIGVPEEIASEDACKIEHVISPESFDALKNHFIKHT